MNKELWYDRVAHIFGAEVNTEMEDVITEGLTKNQLVHGARYCPCKLDKHVDNICPCREFREEGHCHCGLFI